MDNRIDEAIARGLELLLRGQRADVTMDRTQAERRRLQRQAFDALVEERMETMAPMVAPSLAHQAAQALGAVALYPAGQRPERPCLLAGHLGQWHVLVHGG